MAKADPVDEARAARALERGERMTARVGTLEDEPAPTPQGSATARIELLVELTRAAWAMTGLPWASLPRARWPIRVRRLGEPA